MTEEKTYTRIQAKYSLRQVQFMQYLKDGYKATVRGKSVIIAGETFPLAMVEHLGLTNYLKGNK